MRHLPSPALLPEVTFSYLLRTNYRLANGEYAIVLRIRHRGQRKEINIGLSVPEKDWIPKLGLVNSTHKRAQAINKQLAELQLRLQQTWDKMTHTLQDFTLDEFVDRIKGNEEPPETLMEYVNIQIKEMGHRVDIDLAITTFYKYRRTANYVADFLAQKRRVQNIPVSRVDTEFLHEFFQYLRREKRNAQNSALALMNSLKTILQAAVKRGVIRHNPFRDLALTQKPVERGYLTIEEIRALQELDGLPEGMDRNRDIFLFACFTGLSYSDILTLKSHHIITDPDGTKHINKPREKTGVLSYIPLLDSAERILLKYSPTGRCEDFVWRVVSNQKLNASLKEIGSRAGIQKTLFMHLARHTFATTVTLSNGVPLESVGKMIGHSGMKNLMIYAKIVNNKVKADMERVRGLF